MSGKGEEGCGMLVMFTHMSSGAAVTPPKTAARIIVSEKDAIACLLYAGLCITFHRNKLSCDAVYLQGRKWSDSLKCPICGLGKLGGTP